VNLPAKLASEELKAVLVAHARKRALQGIISLKRNRKWVRDLPLGFLGEISSFYKFRTVQYRFA